jgi:predicted dehydrogenase
VSPRAAAPVVALVGCGRWGANILRDLVALGCTVPVVARSEESVERARLGGAAEIVRSVGGLPSVDGAVVATPTAVHADVTEELLALGVPVYVEKPLTADPERAEALARFAPERLFVMDKWRYHAGVEALAAIARSGELGAVVGLETIRVGWGNPHDVDGVWVLAPHDLAIALEILVELPEPRAAVADAVDGETFGLIGLLGRGPWHVLTVSTRDLQRRRSVRLVCADGVASLDDGYADHVLVKRGDEEPERRGIPSEFPLLRELRAFVEYLGGGPPPRSSADEGAAVVRVIARLRELAGVA